MFEVDLGVVMMALAGFLASVLSAFGSWALARLADALGVDRDRRILDAIELAMDEALRSAYNRARERYGEFKVEMESELVKDVTTQILRRFPDWLGRYDYDDWDFVADWVQDRLGLVQDGDMKKVEIESA